MFYCMLVESIAFVFWAGWSPFDNYSHETKLTALEQHSSQPCIPGLLTTVWELTKGTS